MQKFIALLLSALLFLPLSYSQNLNLADQVAKKSMLKDSSKRKWDWEDAVFLYGLSEYGKSHRDPKFKAEIKKYLVTFQERWQKKGLPSINRSDACPAALTALTLKRDWNDDRFLSNLDPIIYYLKNEPRNSIGTINHLGHSWLRIFYPPSIWVDSLMMIGVMSAETGSVLSDQGLSEFAFRQPQLFSNKLQDQNTGLFRHAWYESSERVIPRTESFWLRGNGWALVSTVKILENMPKDHPLFETNLSILRTLAKALMDTQRSNGFWGTLIKTPRSYDETSGTALVGYGLARAYHRGWLSQEALSSAQKAYAAVLSKVTKTKKGYSLGGISGPTNPGGHMNYLLIPKVADKGYGVGPFLMLASELSVSKENVPGLNQ